jgi:hypothetical protein
VDLSALIFVALAVAWAVYLIPKALKHHDDVVRSRSVDRFSHTMRVLARREPVSRKNARLVVTPGRAASAPVVTTKHPETAVGATPTATVRESANRAARRRRRVLGLLLLANVAVLGVAAFGLISWAYAALPGGLLVAWLVACRLMVRREQRTWSPVSRRVATPTAQDEPVEDLIPVEPVEDDDDDIHNTTQTPAIADPSLWDPMPVTLPTYVTKPAATRRTVRTIDLDSTGVWTSGRTEGDSQIAREADEAARAERSERERSDDSRAFGS